MKKCIVFSLSFFIVFTLVTITSKGLKAEELYKPSKRKIALALTETLKIISERAIASLDRRNSFYENPYIRLEFPSEVLPMFNTLAGLGITEPVDKVKDKLNKCAEISIRDLKPVLFAEIDKTAIDEPSVILFGNKNALTEYFRLKTYDQLVKTFYPTVKNNIDAISLKKDWDELVDKYKMVPYHKEIQFDLVDFITRKTLDGYFEKLKEEEEAFRSNPDRWKSASVARVFEYRQKKSNK